MLVYLILFKFYQGNYICYVFMCIYVFLYIKDIVYFEFFKCMVFIIFLDFFMMVMSFVGRGMIEICIYDLVY